MDNVLVELLPVIAAAGIVPLYPIIVLLLLQSVGGLARGSAFVAGATVVRLVQGVLFGLIVGTAAQAYPDSGQGPVVSTLLLVVGLLLLVTALRKWRKVEDPDAPPQWMSSLGGMTPLKAASTGALIVTVDVKQWVFTLSALGIIGAAEPAPATAVWLYLFYVVMAQLLVLLPLLAYALAPERAARPLSAARGWLEKNNRPIVIAVSLIFGAWFFYKGVNGLIG